MKVGNRSNGGHGGFGLTQDECAELLGVTRARVSQIERSALKKLYALAIESPVLREVFESAAEQSTAVCSYCNRNMARPGRRMCTPCSREAVAAQRRSRERRAAREAKP